MRKALRIASYTLFGSAGSNQITGSSSNFDLSSFDDVIHIDNVNVSGDITGATLCVTFLNTGQDGDNETFFDYSAGFEEFAIITTTDAGLLEAANIGLGEAAPQTVTYDLNTAGPDQEKMRRVLELSAVDKNPAAAYVRGLFLLMAKKPADALKSFETIKPEIIPPAFLYAPYRLRRHLAPREPNRYLKPLRQAIAAGNVSPFSTSTGSSPGRRI